VRLIYITGAFPYPLTTGYLRHFHLLSRLALDHQIRLFSLVGGGHEISDREQVEQLGIEVQTFDVAATAWRRQGRRLGRLLPRVVVAGARELRRAVADCVESGWPQAAILSGKTTSGVLPVLAGLPLVVDACDATSMRLISRLPERERFDRLVHGLELRAVRSVERRLYRRADRVLVASRRDGEHLGYSTKMSVVPNGVDTSFWSRNTTARPLDTVVFTGNMSYDPNEDAALRLITDVWPIVRARRPDARLLIVGTSPRSRLVAAGGRNGIEVTGRVDDMREYLERGTVFAAPIRHGAGIQNKLLEALAMQLPVVASTNAAAGLVINGEPSPAYATDELDDMAKIILAELDAADRDPTPIESNRAWVAERFDWNVSAGQIDDILRHLVDASREGGLV
jgi:glycosyltransferase involved in cell wall biosynthesis